jgi:hypothetical protein
VIYIRHTYSPSEPHCPLFIFCEVRCLACFYHVPYLLYLRILKLTLPYLLLEGWLYLYSDSFRMSNEPKIESFKLLIQFPMHLVNPGRVHFVSSIESAFNWFTAQYTADVSHPKIFNFRMWMSFTMCSSINRIFRGFERFFLEIILFILELDPFFLFGRL